MGFFILINWNSLFLFEYVLNFMKKGVLTFYSYVTSCILTKLTLILIMETLNQPKLGLRMKTGHS